MRRFFISLLLLLLLISSNSWATLQPGIWACSTRGSVLVIEGDSIANYLGPYLDQAIDYAVGGSYIGDVVSRWAAVLAANPTVVYIHAGVNDVYYGIDDPNDTLEIMENNILWITASCDANGIQLILANIGTNGGYTADMITKLNSYNTWLATTYHAAHPNVVILDFLSWAEHGSGNPTLCWVSRFDGACIHPNTLGLWAWADYINALVPIQRYLVWDVDPGVPVPGNCQLIYSTATSADQQSGASKTALETSLTTQCSPCPISPGRWGICPYCLLLSGGCAGKCP